MVVIVTSEPTIELLEVLRAVVSDFRGAAGLATRVVDYGRKTTTPTGVGHNYPPVTTTRTN